MSFGSSDARNACAAAVFTKRRCRASRDHSLSTPNCAVNTVGDDHRLEQLRVQAEMVGHDASANRALARDPYLSLNRHPQ
jgi:hypothetical protein